jgi:hypothetical protein
MRARAVLPSGRPTNRDFVYMMQAESRPDSDAVVGAWLDHDGGATPLLRAQGQGREYVLQALSNLVHFILAGDEEHHGLQLAIVVLGISLTP